MRIFDFLNKNETSKYNKRIASLYKKVFSTPEGKEVLADLMMTSYVLESTEGDLLKEGARKTILRILTLLNYNADKFQAVTAKMVNPNNEDEDY